MGFFDDITKAVQNVANTVNTDIQAQTHTIVGRVLSSNPITGGYLAAAQSVSQVGNSLLHAKDLGDAVSQLPGAIVNAYVGTGENIVKNAASTLGAITKNKTLTDVSKGIGIAQDVTQHDPTDSLKIIGGGLGVAAAVFTGGGSAVAGVASITAGVAGIAGKTLAQFQLQEQAAAIGSNPAPTGTQGAPPAVKPTTGKKHWWQRFEAWLKGHV